MKHILFFLLTISAAFIACSSVKKTNSLMITQGITGYITEATGNQMPMKGVPPAIAKGILTTVLVYEPTSLRQVSRIGTSPVYTAISTKLVASVKTDSTGAFTVELPAGSYSLFVKQGRQFYANLFDVNNNIALFTVEEGKLTRADLKVSSGATYQALAVNANLILRHCFGSSSGNVEAASGNVIKLREILVLS